jgi:hypothetical protein
MLLPLNVLGFLFCVGVVASPKSSGWASGWPWVAVFSLFAIYVCSKGGVLGFYIFDMSALRGGPSGGRVTRVQKTLGEVCIQTLPPQNKIHDYLWSWVGGG